MEFVIKASAKQLKGIATDLVDNLLGEWDEEICRFAGVYHAELVEGILESYEFSKYVEKKVMAHGPDFLDYPFDYDNYMTELNAINRHIEVFCDIWREAEHSDRNAVNQETLIAALHIVKKAGYQVI
jgi:hypothetical protein